MNLQTDLGELCTAAARRLDPECEENNQTLIDGLNEVYGPRFKKTFGMYALPGRLRLVLALPLPVGV